MLDICYLDSPCLAAIYYKNDHPIQTMHKITNLFLYFQYFLVFLLLMPTNNLYRRLSLVPHRP